MYYTSPYNQATSLLRPLQPPRQPIDQAKPAGPRTHFTWHHHLPLAHDPALLERWAAAAVLWQAWATPSEKPHLPPSSAQTFTVALSVVAQPLPPNFLLQYKSQYTLFTATLLPVPPNAVSCEYFSVTLKNPVPKSSRILSFSEFVMAFSQYTEIIYSAFLHRRRKLNDYQAIIAELALSYGDGHFYTYHKLSSAKCAVRVTQWNQCTSPWSPQQSFSWLQKYLQYADQWLIPLCHVFRLTPLPTRPDSAQVKSTSYYIPWPATTNVDLNNMDTRGRSVSF